MERRMDLGEDMPVVVMGAEALRGIHEPGGRMAGGGGAPEISICSNTFM